MDIGYNKAFSLDVSQKAGKRYKAFSASIVTRTSSTHSEEEVTLAAPSVRSHSRALSADCTPDTVPGLGYLVVSESLGYLVTAKSDKTMKCS